MRKLKVVFLVIRNVRNWLPLLLARAGFGPFPPRILLRNGLGIAMPATDGGGWGEVFEPLIADVYRSPCGFRGLIVDIGANAGAFTLLAARRNPDATVFAFEPQAKVLEILRENLQTNGLGRVRSFSDPVTGDGRAVCFGESQERPGSSGIHYREGNRALRPSVTLDVVPWRNASSAFLKLDCEGAEGEILQWIAEHREILPANLQVVSEYHPWCPVPLAESLARMQRAGFTCSTEEAFQETYFRAVRGDPKTFSVRA
jgi:FkbM family methyltransferase